MTINSEILNSDNLDLEKLLQAGIKEFGHDLTLKECNDFFKFKELLLEWNEKINLTAIESEKDVIIKHFIDSLSIIPYLPKKTLKLVDIGTGAGFPGIPLSIITNNLNITLLDSLDKRVKFLNIVIKELGLKDINAVHGRSEDLGTLKVHREIYDIAIARAVANLPVLLEYCLPFVKIGGLFIAMKGSNIEEVKESKKALDILGGKIEDQFEITLPFTDMKRNIIIIKKFRHTPAVYPRKAGTPTKNPIK